MNNENSKIEKQLEEAERKYSPQHKAKLRAMAHFYNPWVEAPLLNREESIDYKLFSEKWSELSEEERVYVIDSSMKQEIKNLKEFNNYEWPKQPR